MVKGSIVIPKTPAELAFRRSSCERKKWFRTNAAAQARLPGPGARVYHCRFCDGYHITTKPQISFADPPFACPPEKK